MWHLLAQDVDGFWLVKLLCQGVCKNGAESIIVEKKTPTYLFMDVEKGSLCICLTCSKWLCFEVGQLGGRLDWNRTHLQVLHAGAGLHSRGS